MVFFLSIQWSKSFLIARLVRITEWHKVQKDRNDISKALDYANTWDSLSIYLWWILKNQLPRAYFLLKLMPKL